MTQFTVLLKIKAQFNFTVEEKNKLQAFRDAADQVRIALAAVDPEAVIEIDGLVDDMEFKQSIWEKYHQACPVGEKNPRTVHVLY